MNKFLRDVGFLFTGMEQEEESMDSLGAILFIHFLVSENKIQAKIRPYNSVLWIRIRSDPKLFAGSGSGSVIIKFGSGSDELQFLMTKIA